MLHFFDKMVIAQAEHHKTKSVNDRIYGRSGSRFHHFKGINNVPRGFPQDCYAKAWWDTLTKFEQDTISKVAPLGIEKMEQELTKIVGTTSPPNQPIAGPSNSNASSSRTMGESSQSSSHQPGVRGEGSMSVD